MKLFHKVLWCVVLAILVSAAAIGDVGEVIPVSGIVGHGKNRQLALADAFRNAISQAIGTYVVTARTWDGESLDKKIFDNSDAVVSSHRIVAEQERGGRCSITIDAKIVRNEMMKFIRKEATTKVGEGELANLLAKRRAIENAVQSLELLFQNWRENTYRVEKYGNISIAPDDDTASDIVKLSVPFIVTFRWDAYSVFLGKVRNVLSRIAVYKVSGEYSKKNDRDFRETNYQVYSQAGLVVKNEDGYIMDGGNPNGYGEVRIVTSLSDDKSLYELYIVPNQVRVRLNTLLTRDAEMRFVFTSAGGATIASQSVSCEVYSFGWCRIPDDDLEMGYSQQSENKTITFVDQIKTYFRDADTSFRRLYHASIPVSLSDAPRISGCMITVCSPSGKDYCLDANGEVTSELINKTEWDRIDRKPRQRAELKEIPKQVVSDPSDKARPAPKADVNDGEAVLSEKDSAEVPSTEGKNVGLKCCKCAGKGYLIIEEKCGSCGGAGKVYLPPKKLISGWSSGRNSVCDACNGRGKKIRREKCRSCRAGDQR